MTYLEIGTIKDTVKECLEKFPTTRNNDDYLFLKVVEARCPDITGRSFAYVLFHRDELGIPPYESVTRVRRKIQEECPSLRAAEKVEQYREETEMFMREWSVS